MRGAVAWRNDDEVTQSDLRAVRSSSTRIEFFRFRPLHHPMGARSRSRTQKHGLIRSLPSSSSARIWTLQRSSTELPHQFINLLMSVRSSRRVVVNIGTGLTILMSTGAKFPCMAGGWMSTANAVRLPKCNRACRPGAAGTVPFVLGGR